MTLSTVILEDQLPARRILERYVTDTPWLDLAISLGDPLEALSYFQTHSCDVLLLDLHMPQLDGFAVRRAIANPPAVIVTTAFSERALEGFEHDVVDYLVKPITYERFLRAVTKAQQWLGRRHAPEAPSPGPAHITVKVDKGALRHIALDDILFLKAAGDYVEMTCTEETLFIAGTLGKWHDSLPKEGFVRVHRSFIVAMRHVSALARAGVMVGEHEIPVGRSYQDIIREAFELEGEKRFRHNET